MSLTHVDYAALSAALKAARWTICGDGEGCKACQAAIHMHRRCCEAVADSIQQRKPGGGFDRERFLADAGSGTARNGIERKEITDHCKRRIGRERNQSRS